MINWPRVIWKSLSGLKLIIKAFIRYEMN